MRVPTTYGTVLLRAGIVALFLWFGLSQIASPDNWISWVPAWPTALTGLTAQTIVLLNGGFEVVFALLLAAGFYTRAVALVLALHMFFLVYEIGYNDIGVRDFVLAISTLSLALTKPDQFRLDNRWNRE